MDKVQLYYGLNSLQALWAHIRFVCIRLGNGKNNCADLMMLRTAVAETMAGMYRDSTPLTCGVGLFQFDQIRFDDTIARQDADELLEVFYMFGYRLDQIELADLADDPLLSCIMARLAYKSVVAEIPLSIEEQAYYWKRHWNTYHPNAKGSIQGFLDKNAAIRQRLVANGVLFK